MRIFAAVFVAVLVAGCTSSAAPAAPATQKSACAPALPGLSGLVRDEGGHGLHGVIVEIGLGGGGYDRAGATGTNAAGYWEFCGYNKGTFHLTFSKSGYVTQELHVEKPKPDITTHDIVLRAG